MNRLGWPTTRTRPSGRRPRRDGSRGWSPRPPRVAMPWAASGSRSWPAPSRSSLVLAAIVGGGRALVRWLHERPAYQLRFDEIDPRTRTSGLVRARSGRVPRRPPPEREATREPLRPRRRPRQVEGRLPPLRLGEEGQGGREVRPEPHRRPARLPRAGGALGEDPKIVIDGDGVILPAEDIHPEAAGRLMWLASVDQPPFDSKPGEPWKKGNAAEDLAWPDERVLAAARLAEFLRGEAGRRAHPRAPWPIDDPPDGAEHLAVRRVRRPVDGLLGRAARRREAGGADGLEEMGHAPRTCAASRRDAGRARSDEDLSEVHQRRARREAQAARMASSSPPRSPGPPAGKIPLRIVPLLRVVCAARAGGGPARASGSTRTATGPEHLGPICGWGRTGSWPIDSARSG